MRRLIASIALLVGLQAAPGAFADPPPYTAQSVSDQMINQLGTVQPANGQPGAAQVFNRLLPFTTRRDISYRLDIAQNEQVNTTSAPDGRVVVFTGLLNRIQADPSALAFVEAHELAHLDNYDADKKMNLQVGTGIAGIVLAWHNNFGTQVGAAIAHQLLNSGYSRQLDAQADQRALAMVRSAGYDPNGALLALKVAARMEANGVRVFPYKVRAVDRYSNTIAWMNQNQIAIHEPTDADINQLMAASEVGPGYEGQYQPPQQQPYYYPPPQGNYPNYPDNQQQPYYPPQQSPPPPPYYYPPNQ